ncbi:MAG TPA: hypothetical protein VI818_04760 [Candidatus Thermoplasmatota archaeon]|nr:hypothetical protein [Candidatus Thermoplasmatota archaeon]
MRRRDFFEQIPSLFARANQRLWEHYEEALFTIRRPFTHGNYWAVRRYCGGNPPRSALEDTHVHYQLDPVLARANYPEAGPLERLEDFTEGRVDLASALLHFYSPAYPIYDDTSVRGLNQLDADIQFTPNFEETTVEHYQSYIDVIQRLKDDVPYLFVPERQYYLTRIVQEALWQLGLDSPVPSGYRKAPSRRTGPSAN